DHSSSWNGRLGFIGRRLHCIASLVSLWQLVSALLAGGRTLLVEQEAMGVEAMVVKYPPDRALDYAELEALVRATLPTQRSFLLVGESFSGPVAVALAASSPVGLRGLVLVCSFVRSPIALPRVLHPLISLLPVWLVPI